LRDQNSSYVNDPRHQKKYVFHRTIFRKLLVGFLSRILKLVIKINADGLENIPESDAAILTCNHLTNFDVFPLQILISRPLFFMSKSELHENPFMDRILRNLGAFPVHRGQRDQWALHHARKVLEHHQILAIFPEGTRSKGAGLRAGKTGAARFSIQMDCPIIPVAIDGTQNILKSFPKRTSIQIKIGEPLYPRPEESVLALTDRLMFTIAGMLPQKLKGVYARKPQGFDAY
jgi:1-acyl-sn-glycerol-3-phosphate acyltransferase